MRTPAVADLVLEVRFEIVLPDQGLYLLCVAIVDPKTSIVLWRITEHMQPWARETTGRKNFDEAMTNLVSDLNKLIVSPRATTGATTLARNAGSEKLPAKLAIHAAEKSAQMPGDC